MHKSSIKIKPIFFWLVLTIILKQIVWAAFIPPWQFPDEQAHFAQVQNFSERKSIKPFFGPNTSAEIIESEKLLGTHRDGFGNNLFTYHPEYKLPYAAGNVGIHEAELKNIPREKRLQYITYEATVYPPLYYIGSTVFYNWVNSSDILTRIFTVRLGNILIFLSLAYVTFRTGLLIFAKKQEYAYYLTILVTYHPMVSFVMSGTNSDNLFTLVVLTAFYISLNCLISGLNRQRLILMFLVFTAAIWTKPQGQLVGFIYLFPLINSFIISSKKSKLIILPLILLVLIMIFGFMGFNFIQGRQLLPEILTLNGLLSNKYSFISHISATLTHTYREVMPWYWGVFRWLSLTYPRPVHRIINWLVLFSLIGLGIYIIRLIKRKTVTVSGKTFLFSVYTVFMYFSAITVFDFLFIRSHHFSLGVQGRYFFPVIVPQTLLILLGIQSLGTLSSYLKLLPSLLGLGMILLHSFAQIFVITSYFDTSRLATFFNQASQYKPVFFKSPFLELIVFIYIISLIVLMWNYIYARRNKYTSDQLGKK